MDAIFAQLTTKLQYETGATVYSTLESDEERMKFAMIYYGLVSSKTISVYDLSKSATLATRFTDNGNQHIQSCWQRSVNIFTCSITFAPPNSKELARAYANRSAALCNAGLYEDCLLDIERALKIGYPKELIAKLYARRAKSLLVIEGTVSSQVKQAMLDTLQSLEYMEETTRKTVINTLAKIKSNHSFKTPHVKWNNSRFMPTIPTDNPNISGTSDAIELRHSKKYGSHVVAARDIKAGEPLLVQKMYAFSWDQEKFFQPHTYCWNCFKRVWASIPCHQCVNVIYCNEKCRDIAWKEHHDIECTVVGAMLHDDMTYNSQHFMSLRFAVKALKEAGSFFALKAKIRKIDSMTDPIDKCFDGSGYLSVYSLMKLSEESSLDDALNSVRIVIYLSAATDIFGKKLSSLDKIMANEHAIFIGVLILRHMGIRASNMQQIIINDDDGDSMNKGVAFIPFLALCKHSCDAPTFQYSLDDTHIVVAVQTIKKGEQICINYGAHYQDAPTFIRRCIIATALNIRCDCIACINDWPPMIRFSSNLKKSLSRNAKKQLAKMKTDYIKYKSLKQNNIDIDLVHEALQWLTRNLNFCDEYFNYPSEELIKLKHLFVYFLKRIPH